MLAEVGGKAANLGEMSTAGLPVPPGFCLTTAAYCRALDGAALGEVLAALDGTDVVDYSLDALAARARSAIRHGKRYITSDATEFSRPILERSGLVKVSTTTPYEWTRRA